MTSEEVFETCKRRVLTESESERVRTSKRGEHERVGSWPS